MAKKSVESLYISLGLDMSQLTADFIAADKTVAENIAKLNRENNIIRLRSQLEISGLDPVKDKTKIVDVQMRALNEQISNQKDRVRLASAAWMDMSRHMGDTATQTQKAEAAMLREKLALQALEKELQALNAIHQTSDQGKGVNSLVNAYNSLKSGTQGVLGNITGAITQLNTASSSTGSALEFLATNLGKLKHPAVIAAAAIAGLPVVAYALSKQLIDLAKPAISAGDAIYTMSRRMASSTADAAAFNTVCKAMGTDTNLVLSSLERISKQWLTAGASGNAATNALKAFGVSLTDSEGRLLSHHDRMIALAQGFERARAAGQQMELQNLLIRNGMGDMVVAIEDYRKVSEDVSNRLVKAGLANPTLAHELQGELNLMELQIGQIKTAFSNAMMPVVADLIPGLTKVFGELVRIIKENKDGIQAFGEAATVVLKAIAGLSLLVAKAMAAVGKAIPFLQKDKEQLFIEAIVKDDSVKSFDDYMERRKKEKPDWFFDDPMLSKLPSFQKSNESYYKHEWAKVVKAREQAARAAEESEKKKQLEAAKILTEEETAARNKALENFREVEILKYRASHDTLDSQIEEIRQWEDAQLKAYENVNDRTEIHASIRALAAAKIAEAERKEREESEKRAEGYLKDAREQQIEGIENAYQKELAKIKEWKKAVREKATTAEEVAAIEINAAAKAARAYENEIKRIKDATKSFQDEIYALTHSQYEVDVKQVMDQARKGLKEGVDPNVLKDWMRVKFAEIEQNAKEREGYLDKRFNYKPSYNVPNYLNDARRALNLGEYDNLDTVTNPRLPNQGLIEIRDAAGNLVLATKNMANAISELPTNLPKNSDEYQTEKLIHAIREAANSNTGNPITVNVEIGTAVTPDSQAMNELADTLSNKIVNAVYPLGGGDNSYKNG